MIRPFRPSGGAGGYGENIIIKIFDFLRACARIPVQPQTCVMAVPFPGQPFRLTSQRSIADNPRSASNILSLLVPQPSPSDGKCGFS